LTWVKISRIYNQKTTLKEKPNVWKSEADPFGGRKCDSLQVEALS
jgi:hypothetical protein